MDAKEVEAMFTRADGSYLFARWRRPIVPVIFGVAEASLPPFKGAIEAVVALAGHQMAETDAEMGANLMIFAFRDWEELLGIPKLEGLVPELAALMPRLVAAGANQYRVFRLEKDGAIRAAFVFLRMDASLAEVSAEVLALSQAVQVMLLWSERAFAEVPPLGRVEGKVVLRTEIAGLIRAGYDRVLPDVTRDPAHALRLSARVGV